MKTTKTKGFFKGYKPTMTKATYLVLTPYMEHKNQIQ
jgi:hypothetical protein